VVAQRPVSDPVPDFEPLPPPHFPAQGWWNTAADEWMSEDRLQQGYTLVLPGIEGRSPHNISIAHGLIDGGHSSAVEIFDWTTGSWVLFPYHLTGYDRNHEQARQIARRILAYQNEYPGRPVRLIGHSGGGAMVILVLEELPADHRVTQAILLSAALSPDHNLCRALRQTEDGIWNLHSPLDIIHLRAGTSALGTIDRIHTAAAGAIGFRTPSGLDPEDVQLYEEKLTQVPYQPQMLEAGSFGGHQAFVGRRFVKNWLAPLMANYQ
jgi:pimeloyl-ACP methyl ester carboxylesterase